MIEVCPFKSKHYLEVSGSEPSDLLMGKFITSEHLEALENSLSRTLKTEDEKVIACFGLIEQWSKNAYAWAILDKRYMKTHMLAVHRWVKAFLVTSGFERIETMVEYDFDEGHRWMDLLGFQLEAHEMKKYYPNGKSASLYARVK